MVYFSLPNVILGHCRVFAWIHFCDFVTRNSISRKPQMAQLCAVVWTFSFCFPLLQIIGQCVYGHIALMMEVCVSVQTQPTNFFRSHNVLVVFCFVLFCGGWGGGVVLFLLPFTFVQVCICFKMHSVLQIAGFSLSRLSSMSKCCDCCV